MRNNKLETLSHFKLQAVPGAQIPSKLTIEGEILIATPVSRVTETFMFEGNNLSHQFAPRLKVGCLRDEKKNQQIVFLEYNADQVSLPDVPIAIHMLDKDGNDVGQSGQFGYNKIPRTTIWKLEHHSLIDQTNLNSRSGMPVYGVRIERATELKWHEIPFRIKFDANAESLQTLEIELPDYKPLDS